MQYKTSKKMNKKTRLPKWLKDYKRLSSDELKKEQLRREGGLPKEEREAIEKYREEIPRDLRNNIEQSLRPIKSFYDAKGYIKDQYDINRESISILENTILNFYQTFGKGLKKKYERYKKLKALNKLSADEKLELKNLSSNELIERIEKIDELIMSEWDGISTFFLFGEGARLEMYVYPNEYETFLKIRVSPARLLFEILTMIPDFKKGKNTSDLKKISVVMAGLKALEKNTEYEFIFKSLNKDMSNLENIRTYRYKDKVVQNICERLVEGIYKRLFASDRPIPYTEPKGHLIYTKLSHRSARGLLKKAARAKSLGVVDDEIFDCFDLHEDSFEEILKCLELKISRYYKNKK